MKKLLIPFAVVALATPLTASAAETIDISADKVVYELPAGVEGKSYLHEGTLFRKWGSDAIKTESITASLSTVAEGSDGKVYISHAVGGTSAGYMVGTRDGDKVTVKFPQVLQCGDSYMAVMRLEPTTIEVPGYDEEDPVMSVPSYKIYEGPQEIVYTIEDGRYVQAPNTNIGFVQADGSWGGYGEYGQTFSPFNNELVVVPEDAERFNVAIRYDNDTDLKGEPYVYELMKGARKGSEVYIQGLSNQYPDSWVKGTVNGDRITFENGQFLGIGGYSTEYFCTGYDTPEFVPGYNTWDHVYTVTTSLELAYDAQSGVISALGENDCMFVNGAQSVYSYGRVFKAMTFTPQPDNIDPTPIMPLFKKGVNTWDNGMDPFLTFQLRPLNIYGQLLDTNNLSFEIEVEGAPYVFTSWDYWMDEDMTIIPWNFDGPFIQVLDNGWTNIEFQEPYLRQLKIKAVYRMGDELIYSLPQSPDKPEAQDPVSGVTVTEVSEVSDSPVLATEYYDLKGNRVDNPAKGFYILRNIHQNGAVSHTKVIL